MLWSVFFFCYFSVFYVLSFWQVYIFFLEYNKYILCNCESNKKYSLKCQDLLYKIFYLYIIYILLCSYFFFLIVGKDMMCVHSLDGTLSFFEQERFSFSRFLPKNLIPGPITYVLKTDSFVTVNGFFVESYRLIFLVITSKTISYKWFLIFWKLLQILITVNVAFICKI